MSSSSSSSNQEERHGRRLPMFIFILVSLAFLQIGILISVSNSNLHMKESINNELVLDNDNDNDDDFPNADAATRIPVFYNVFTGSEESIPRVKNIVKEQFSQLRPEQHEVFVRSIGVPFEIENATLVRHDEDGDEAQTLALLWQYCKDHPNPADESAKVVYLHSKGSFHPMVKNDRLRRFLTRGALSQECANLPSSDPCNVCSSRMSPLPHPHTSGNMWLAKCDYVQKLINPMMFEEKMRQIYGDSINPCVGTGRFAAEHWIHSHPSVMPCDLFKDASYVWAYDNVPNGDFEIDLKAAPRFDLKPYQSPMKSGCGDSGYKINDRLTEYQALYAEEAPESWWGWKLFNASHDSFKQLKLNTQNTAPRTAER